MPTLFSMFVHRNIRFVNPGPSQEAIADSAQIANTHDFNIELPSDVEIEVQQSALSGGKE
jgi:ABC-type multidrug transport system fused ATPase/permease subunit